MSQGPEWDGEDMMTRFVLNSIWWAWGGYEWTSHLGHPGKEWRTKKHYCTWYGISCNDRSEVISMHLEGNHLQGTIPDIIGELDSLVELHLGYNEKLTGTLPASIGKLTKLNYLSIPFTGLSGEPPSSLQNLTSLLYIDATHLGDSYYPVDLKDRTHTTSQTSQNWIDIHKLGQLTNLTGWDPYCYNGVGGVGSWDCPAYKPAMGTYWAQLKLQMALAPWTTRGRYGTINQACQGIWCTDMDPGKQHYQSEYKVSGPVLRPRGPQMDTVNSVGYDANTDLDAVMADATHVPTTMDPGLGNPDPKSYRYNIVPIQIGTVD